VSEATEPLATGAAPGARGRGPRGVLALVGALHSAPALLPRLPLTLWRLAGALRPGGGGVPDRDFLAFGARDVGFRPWYAKIAREQAERGRVGFVWDDGLGLPLGTRFYNNWATYALYRALGARRYAALSIVLFLAACALPLALRGEGAMAAAVAVLLAGSPVLLAAQLHGGKPEVLWWALFPPLALALWEGHWLAAGLCFSAIAMVNFTVAFLSGVTLLLAAAPFTPGWTGLLLLAAGSLPGLVKTALRLRPFLRARMLGSLAREQSDVVSAPGDSWAARLRRMGTRDMLYYGGVYAVTLACIVPSVPRPLAAAVLAAGCMAVAAAGQKVFYLCDAQSFWLWHLALLSALLAWGPSWVGVAGLVFFAYLHGWVLGLPMPNALAATAVGASRAAVPYPFVEPVAGETLREPVRRFFAGVPDGSRVLLETHTHTRDFGGYRAFLQVCEEVLPLRGVEVVPDEYVRIAHMDYYADVIAAFHAGTPAARLREVAAGVGARFALAYSAAFARELEEAGWEPVAVLGRASVPGRAAALLALPPGTLHLLALPEGGGVISPPVEVVARGNELTWEGRAGTEYRVRYAWYPEMSAVQGGTPVPAGPGEPEEGTSLRFVRVTAAHDGPVTLRYRGRWS
jgi:hypothetical protein